LVESLISLGFVFLFCVIGWAVNAGAEAMIWGGIGLAALARAERLPNRWWLSPTSHHDLIPRDERLGVFVWGAVGGTGFVVIVMGIIVTTIGLWRTLVSPA